NPEKVECAVIASDHNNDGKPDPTNVIDVCAANAPTAAAPSAPVGASSATLAGAPLAAPDAGASVQAPPPASANSAFADAGAAKKTPAAKGKKEGQ
ncbi:MAG TPA: hypothetical protein VJT73_21090, partial [Polyangiaceae bacterium]|nr:hypothetical protein [Polyangiaceae bacterium]